MSRSNGLLASRKYIARNTLQIGRRNILLHITKYFSCVICTRIHGAAAGTLQTLLHTPLSLAIPFLFCHAKCVYHVRRVCNNVVEQETQFSVDIHRNTRKKSIKQRYKTTVVKKNRHCLYSVAVHWLTIAFTDCKHYHVTMSHKYKYDATYTLTSSTSTNKINATNHKTHGERALRTELYIQYYPYKLNWLTNWIRWTDTTDCPESSVSSIRVSYEYDSI